MNHVERFRALMNFQPVDRLPRWEWAMWWDETIARWHEEGLPRNLKFSQVFDIAQYFGLDPYQQFWFSTTDPTIEATQHHVEGIVSNMDDYLRIRAQLFPDHSRAIESMAAWAQRQARGFLQQDGAMAIGQVDIEQDDIGIAALQSLAGLAQRGDAEDFIAARDQECANVQAGIFFVVDNQYRRTHRIYLKESLPGAGGWKIQSRRGSSPGGSCPGGR